MTGRWLTLLLGLGLLGVGSFALVHPEFAHGGGLILLGLAALERGSRRTRRLFNLVSNALDGKPRWSHARRRPRPRRPAPVRPHPGWQPVT